jgi:hypothetical protein
MAALENGGTVRTLLSFFVYRIDRTKFTPNFLWADLSRVEWLLRKLERNLFMQTATWPVSRQLTEAAGSRDTRLPADDGGEYFRQRHPNLKSASQQQPFYRMLWVARSLTEEKANRSRLHQIGEESTVGSKMFPRRSRYRTLLQLHRYWL